METRNRLNTNLPLAVLVAAIGLSCLLWGIILLGLKLAYAYWSTR